MPKTFTQEWDEKYRENYRHKDKPMRDDEILGYARHRDTALIERVKGMVKTECYCGTYPDEICPCSSIKDNLLTSLEELKWYRDDTEMTKYVRKRDSKHTKIQQDFYTAYGFYGSDEQVENFQKWKKGQWQTKKEKE